MEKSHLMEKELFIPLTHFVAIQFHCTHLISNVSNSFPLNVN